MNFYSYPFEGEYIVVSVKCVKFALNFDLLFEYLVSEFCEIMISTVVEVGLEELIMKIWKKGLKLLKLICLLIAVLLNYDRIDFG